MRAVDGAQDDRKNGSHSGNYALSRYNRLAYGTQVEGPIPCRGKERCPHNYCRFGYPSSSVGSPCLWEQEYAARLESSYRCNWSQQAACIDEAEFDGLIKEAVNIELQRSRTMTRLNRATTMMGLGREHWQKAAKEAELSNLYLDRLSQRERRLLQVLVACPQRVHQHADLRGDRDSVALSPRT